MGFWSRIKQELIEIIEWVDEGRETVVYKFPVHQEIKNNAKLTVREGQEAVFMYKGQIADVFKPGMYSLKTDNLPVLSTLAGWKYGFESPFKADIYFVTTRQFSDMKWGTPAPIEIIDRQFGPVRVRANGIYSFKVTDAKNLIRNFAGTDPNFDTEEVASTLREHIVADFTETVSGCGMSLSEMRAKTSELSKLTMDKTQASMEEFGITLKAFKVRQMLMPQEVGEAMDKSASMAMIGDMGRFQQYNMANAVGKMGDQPGGAMGNMAGLGMGAGMGLGMMGMMPQMMPGMMPGYGGYQQQQPGYGYPQQMPQQGMPYQHPMQQQQGMGGMPYPQQGMPQQGMPQQGMPQQGMPQQGMPQQGMQQAPSNMSGHLQPQPAPAVPQPQSPATMAMQIQQMQAAGLLTAEQAQQMLANLQKQTNGG